VQITQNNKLYRVAGNTNAWFQDIKSLLLSLLIDSGPSVLNYAFVSHSDYYRSRAECVVGHVDSASNKTCKQTQRKQFNKEKAEMPDNLVTKMLFNYTVKIHYFDQLTHLIGICEKYAGIDRKIQLRFLLQHVHFLIQNLQISSYESNVE